ncbi:MAG: DUF2085 domain-containing protein [archaeon]|nr:DUF2085 domain-containing protein [archaeon]
MKIEKYSKYICHRKPERSFFYKNHQFPVCARCTGFYISGIITILILKLYPIDYQFISLNFSYYSYFNIINLLLIGIALLIPCIIDGTTQYLNKRESNNILRIITGLLGGVGLILIYRIIMFKILTLI